MQTQKITTKDFSYLKKLKSKNLKSVPPCDNTTKPAKKKSKQKRFKCQQKRIREPKKIPAIGNNTINTTKKRKSVILIRSRISAMIRKATMPVTAPSQKTSVGFGNFSARN